MQQQFSTQQEADRVTLPQIGTGELPSAQTPTTLEPEQAKAISRLVKRLRRRSEVRALTEPLLQQAQPLETITPLLAALANPSDSRWKERTVAAWALGRAQLTAEQQEVAADALCAVVANKQKRGRRLLQRSVRMPGRSLLLSIPFVLLLLYGLFYGDMGIMAGVPFSKPEGMPPLLYICLYNTYLGIVATVLCSVLLAPVVWPLSVGLDVSRTNRVREIAAKTLGRLRRPQSVGTLAAAVYDYSPRVCWVAWEALEHVLPELSRDHYGQLSAETVPNLCRLLQKSDERFVLLVLEALGKVGDGRAIAAVERVRKERQSVQLQQAVEHILPVLRERAAHEQEATHLLRAAGGASHSPDSLLRPAQSVSEAKPDQLLRPNPPDEEVAP